MAGDRSAASCLQAALEHAGCGFEVLPVRSRAKAPLTRHGLHDATRDEATIQGWWAKWPSAGVAITCGEASGLVVLDVDPPAGEASLAALEDQHYKLPPTLEARTPRGGRHLYFSLVPGQAVRNSAGKLGPGLDVRGEGGYVLAPPTPCYAWVRKCKPEPLPEWLAALISVPATAPSSAGANEAGKIAEGQRNVALTSLAGTMRRRGMTPEAITAALLAENATRCDPPLAEAEVETIARSVARYRSVQSTTREKEKVAPAPVTVAAPPLTVEQARAMLADLLFSIGGFLSSYLAISTAQTHVLAVWVFHTHAIEAADRTPYLHVRSPEKRCGKSLLLDLLKLLVRNPWRTSNASPAAIPRKISLSRPTALLDEADTYIRADDERGETLRGVLDAGFERGGVYSRCVGQGAALKVEDFDVFCPKAIAGLHDLPATVADRSIPIKMKRALPGEIRRRFHRHEAEPAAAALRGRIEACGAPLIPGLKDARPERVLELNDRQNDITEPLLAIADLAGDGWPEYLRDFLYQLFEAEEESEQSLGIRLLADVRVIFDERGVERLASGDLVQALRELPDAPWGDWRGRGITGHALARMLRGFHIKPDRWRDGSQIVRGYGAKSFRDSWARYLPVPPSSQEGSQTSQTSQATESTS